MKRIAIISDVHSNALALAAVLKDLNIFGLYPKVSEVFFLGDLLTYGPQPNEVIESFLRLNERIGCIFVAGNHDWLFFDMQKGKSTYYDSLPCFIRESVDWTLDKLSFDLRSAFEWKNEIKRNSVYLSHANPYGDFDWSYIKTSHDATVAAKMLSKQGFDMGIFGHVHRKMKFSVTVGPNSYTTIQNVGSVGQPRGESSSYSILHLCDDTARVSHYDFQFESSSIIEMLNASSISRDSKIKLTGFYL